MNVTVCQLPADQGALDHAFESLADHCHRTSSQLLLLPEMPFSSWLAQEPDVTMDAWKEAVAQHDNMIRRLEALPPTVVAGTRPVLTRGTPYNEAFVWLPESGYHPVHLKHYLPEEEGFFEASWYRRGPKQFKAADTPAGKVGFLVCTELWYGEWARHFARQGIDFLLSPRATADYSRDKWLAGGRVAAVNAGAFCLSSNRGGSDSNGVTWAGGGWVIDPDGEVLAVTDEDTPFITQSLDLQIAKQAKTTYPRYIPE